MVRDFLGVKALLKIKHGYDFWLIMDRLNVIAESYWSLIQFSHLICSYVILLSNMYLLNLPLAVLHMQSWNAAVQLKHMLFDITVA